MKDLELAPYCLLSLKAKWKEKYRRILFTYKDGRTYVDYPNNTLDVQILVRNVDQHLRAFSNFKAIVYKKEENPDIPKDSTFYSEETDSNQEQSMDSVIESIQNSLRFYRCEINSRCGRMDKKYFSEKTSLFDGLLSIFKTPELFTIDRITISCTLLESIVNVKLKGNTSYW